MHFVICEKKSLWKIVYFISTEEIINQFLSYLS